MIRRGVFSTMPAPLCTVAGIIIFCLTTMVITVPWGTGGAFAFAGAFPSSDAYSSSTRSARMNALEYAMVVKEKLDLRVLQQQKRPRRHHRRRRHYRRHHRRLGDNTSMLSVRSFQEECTFIQESMEKSLGLELSCDCENDNNASSSDPATLHVVCTSSSRPSCNDATPEEMDHNNIMSDSNSCTTLAITLALREEEDSNTTSYETSWREESSKFCVHVEEDYHNPFCLTLFYSNANDDKKDIVDCKGEFIISEHEDSLTGEVPTICNFCRPCGAGGLADLSLDCSNIAPDAIVHQCNTNEEKTYSSKNNNTTINLSSAESSINNNNSSVMMWNVMRKGGGGGGKISGGGKIGAGSTSSASSSNARGRNTSDASQLPYADVAGAFVFIVSLAVMLY